MYSIDAVLDNLGRYDKVTVGAILEEGKYDTKFWLKSKTIYPGIKTLHSNFSSKDRDSYSRFTVI